MATIEINGHVVNVTTGEVWIKKTSKRGREYLSVITSAPRIKKAIRDAIRHEYQSCNVGYDAALDALIKTGMNSARADSFLVLA